MGLPFRRHLEWLCLEGLDLKSIQTFYDNIQLPVPTGEDVDDTLENLSKNIVVPGPKKRLEKRIFRAEDLPVWEKLGYGDLFLWRLGKSSENWTKVGKVLNHPLMRTSLDACLITSMEIEKIAVVLPQVYGLQLTEGAIELYKKYFGNFTDFDKEQWRRYLSRLQDDNYVYTRIFAALTRPREEVLHLCGLPAEKQFSDFLKNVLATANYKFNYYARQSTVDGDVSAMDWAKVGIVAGEKFEKFGASDISDFAKLVQTEFEYVTPHIETISPELAIAMRPKTESDADAKK